MKRRYNKSISAGMSRYIAVGLSVYALELLIILVAQKLGASSILAIGLSYWTGLLVSFWLQKIITFRDRRMHKRILAKQILYTYMLVIFNFLFTITVARMLGSTVPAVIRLPAPTPVRYWLSPTTVTAPVVAVMLPSV